MAQCDFFIVDTDEVRLVEWIVSNDGRLVPGLNYDQPTYAVTKSLHEYLDLLLRIETPKS